MKISNEWMAKMQIVWYVHVTQLNDMNERKWEISLKIFLMMKWKIEWKLKRHTLKFKIESYDSN